MNLFYFLQFHLFSKLNKSWSIHVSFPQRRSFISEDSCLPQLWCNQSFHSALKGCLVCSMWLVTSHISHRQASWEDCIFVRRISTGKKKSCLDFFFSPSSSTFFYLSFLPMVDPILCGFIEWILKWLPQNMFVYTFGSGLEAPTAASKASDPSVGGGWHTPA